MIHENTYTIIIAANTRIHNTQKFYTRVKLWRHFYSLQYLHNILSKFIFDFFFQNF